jgi:hypothetical protein
MLRVPLPKLAPAAFRTMSTGAPTYKLYYHPTLPGRGEYVRLAFEASGTPFADAANAAVYDLLKDTHPTPHFAPPILGVQRAGAGKEFTLSQTPAILAFLGPRLGLVGDVKGEDEMEREERRARVNQLMLTALDFMLEAHDVSLCPCERVYARVCGADGPLSRRRTIRSPTRSTVRPLHPETAYVVLTLAQTRTSRPRLRVARRCSGRSACPNSSRTSSARSPRMAEPASSSARASRSRTSRYSRRVRAPAPVSLHRG